MGQRRISASDLEVGAALPWDVRDKNGKLLLKRGQVLVAETQVERLIAEGMFIEETSSSTSGRDAASMRPSREIPSVVGLLNTAFQRLSQAVLQYHSAPELFCDRIREAASLIDASCKQNRDVALAYICLKQEQFYSISHCIDTAIILNVVASGLGYSEDLRQKAVCAALTMNISMLQLQDQLQKQTVELSPEQRDKIQSHPQDSLAMLKAVGVNDPVWLDVVLHHHELGDGSGYPDHLTATQISDAAKVVQLADLYCARISPRAYRSSVQSNVALRDIFLEGGKGVDPMIAAHFIKEIGIYPPGTIVRLTSGEVGIVSHQAGRSNTPYVHAVIGARGVPLNPPIRRDTSRQEYSIRELIDARKLGLKVNMVTIWGKEAA